MNIEFRNIHQHFGDVHALNDFSATLEGDKITGLLGRNGSGKSTLLAILAGFRKPTSGMVLLDGQPVFENPEVTRRITLIREGGDTIEASEKVEEALRYAAFLRPNWDDDLARNLLESYEVSPKSKLQDLSRGKRSAVGIALGLAAQADLTIFDETYLGLDAPSRYRFYDQLLQQYMDRPRAFILSTHLIEEVSRVLEDIVIIDHGTLLIHDTAEQLSQRGVAISGPADVVDAFVAGRQLIGERRLGRTKSAMIFGTFTSDAVAEARQAGLDLDPLDIQDLFVYLTDPQGGSK